MYILVISRGVPSPQDPQWGCFEKDQAEALASLGHKVVVASVDSRFRMRWRHIGITHFHINNVDYYDSFWIPGKITNLGGRFFNWKIKELQFRRIYSMVKEKYGKPDIICGHFSFCTYLAVNVAQEEHIPLVGIEHNGIFNEKKLSPWTEYSSKIAYQHTDAIITVSRNLKERLYYHLHKDSIVINNMFGLEFFHDKIPQRNNKSVKFIAVGTLGRVKGYDLLIEAFSRIKHSKSTWSLDIIGSGAIYPELQLQIEQLELQDNIHLLGRKNKAYISSALLNASAFVMPSRYENFSVALLEALASGLPCIVSDCGGARDCINEKNGVIIPIEDIDALAHALENMIENIDKYNNIAIAEDCKNRFSPNTIAKQLTEVFQDTINKYDYEH